VGKKFGSAKPFSHKSGKLLGGKSVTSKKVTSKLVGKKTPHGKTLIRDMLGGKTASGKALGGMTLDKVAVLMGYTKTDRVEVVSTRELPTEPTIEDVAEREAVARKFFNPAAAAAAHAAFLARQRSEPAHGK
jgi:hypothetical protein